MIGILKFKKTLYENSIMRPFIAGAILILVVGLMVEAIGNIFLLFLALLLVVIYLLGRFYDKHVDDFLEVSVLRRQTRVDSGDEGVIEISIRQKGILPLLLTTLSLEMDDSIGLVGGKIHNRRNRTFIERPFSLLFWEEKVIRFPFQAQKRGVSKIRSFQLSVPNPFNLDTIYLKLDEPKLMEVIVYPEQKAVSNIEQLTPKWKGDHTTQQSLYIDRTRTIGTRPYEMGDPFNRIHWKASVKEDEFQVKIDEKVSHISWMFLLNVKTNKDEKEQLEETIKQLAYMAYYATRHDISYSLYINILSMDRSPYIHQAEGRGQKHLGMTLELLARIQGSTFTFPYERMLHTVVHKEQIPTDVIQAGRDQAEFEPYYMMFERKGARVHGLHTEGLHKKGVIEDGSLA